MKAILSLVVLLLCAPGVLAADAPRQTEEALRSRVKQFYDLLMAHKARAAEALVAEDTKDYYYDSQKPEIKSYSIEKITWDSSFRTADVTIKAQMQMMFPGAGPQTVAMRFPSTWKLERGTWCWYIDRTRIANGPFGQMKSAPGASGGSANPIVSSAMLHAAVQPDSNQITVDVAGDKDTVVTFTNHLPGPATLKAPEIPGFQIEVQKPNLAAGESTKVLFRYKNAGLEQRTATFTVEPTNQQIPIQIICTVHNK
jgi:hypothetical protein